MARKWYLEKQGPKMWRLEASAGIEKGTVPPQVKEPVTFSRVPLSFLRIGMSKFRRGEGTLHVSFAAGKAKLRKQWEEQGSTSH